MNPPICSRCKKNIAVVFVTKIENGETKNEGLCFKCAKELGIKPVSDLMDRFGITDSDLDNMTKELTEGGGESLQALMESFGKMAPGDEDPDTDGDDGGEDDEESSRAPAFPLFFNRRGS